LAKSGTMIQMTPQMRVLVAIEPVDGRKGIDSLAQLCQEKLAEDPFSGCVFVFRSRRGTAIRLLTYDGQGYWLAQQRLSKGRFRWWLAAAQPTRRLESYETQLLLAADDVSRVRAVAASQWHLERHDLPWPASEAGACGADQAAAGKVCAPQSPGPTSGGPQRS